MVIARIFPRPFGARKNTTQIAKYPRVLYVKPSNKMYLLNGGISSGYVGQKRPKSDLTTTLFDEQTFMSPFLGVTNGDQLTILSSIRAEFKWKL